MPPREAAGATRDHRTYRVWSRWLPLELALLAIVLAGMRMLLVATTRLPNGDVVEYHTYALQFWTQHPIFTSLPVEYPPLAILPFSLTLIPPLTDFQSVFTWWMAAATIVGYVGFLRFSGRRKALAYAVYLVIGAAGTLVARFDIIPALVTVGALWAAQRRRYAAAYLLLAAGVLLKLYPIFLVPLVVVDQWETLAAQHASAQGVGDGLARGGRRLWRAVVSPVSARVAEGVALFVGAVALGFGVALVLDPTGALSEFSYAGARPLQVESTPASLLWLGTLFGIPAHPEFSFVSLNFVGPLDVVLKPLSTVALAAGCLWVYWRFARGRLSLAQAFLAALSVVIVTNKIFSPQYIIWVAPFVAEVYGFNLVWLAVCALTTTIFPYLYAMRNPIQTVTYNWMFMPAVAMRNALLLLATLRAALRPVDARVAPGAERREGELAAETDARREESGVAGG